MYEMTVWMMSGRMMMMTIGTMMIYVHRRACVEEYIESAPPEAPLTCPACDRPLSVDLAGAGAGGAAGGAAEAEAAPPPPPPSRSSGKVQSLMTFSIPGFYSPLFPLTFFLFLPRSLLLTLDSRCSGAGHRAAAGEGGRLPQQVLRRRTIYTWTDWRVCG